MNALHPPQAKHDIPPGCARIVDSNGEGETFWPVSKPLLLEAVKERFPQAKTGTLRVGSEPTRCKYIPRQGLSLEIGETYTVRVPEKVKPVVEEKTVSSASMPEGEPSNTSTTTSTASEELKCGICLETITEQGVMNSCKHDFCFVCIHKWSKVTNQCPMCKAEFSTIERKLIAAAAEDTTTTTSTRRGRPRRTKKTPAVVNVKPKKQKYEYTRQELEQIAGIHDEEDNRAPPPHHNGFGPFFFPMGMHGPMGLHQFFLQTAFPHLPPGFLTTMGVPPSVPPTRNPRHYLSEDEEEDAWFEQDSEDDISVEEEEVQTTQPSRGTASRSMVFTPSGGGSRARLRQLMSMPPEMRNVHRQNNRAAYRTSSAASSQANFQNDMNTLKSMFMPTFDEELIQTVLLQTGNNLDRAVEALLEMQPPAQEQPQSEQPTQTSTSAEPVPEFKLDVDGIIVLDDDIPSSLTSLKRKAEWDNEESQRNSLSATTTETSTGQEKSSSSDGYESMQRGKDGVKRRRLRFSFGEMWEDSEKENEKKEEKKDETGKETDGNDNDQELVELAWQDFAALQKNERKERKQAERKGSASPSPPPSFFGPMYYRRQNGRVGSIPRVLSSSEEAIFGNESNPSEEAVVPQLPTIEEEERENEEEEGKENEEKEKEEEEEEEEDEEGLREVKKKKRRAGISSWSSRRAPGHFGLPPHLRNSSSSLNRRVE